MLIERFIKNKILESLRHFPVVLITGARQVGKSTLTLMLTETKWKANYLTFDDITTLNAALYDPDGFIEENSTPVIIDEVQKAPDIFRAIKLNIDRDRKPGKYLLTGSANIMTLKKISETLAGRVAIHELYPFSWAEFRQTGNNEIIDKLPTYNSAADLVNELPKESDINLRSQIKKLIFSGGYPPPVFMDSEESRNQWFESYRKNYIERDIRDIANLEHIPEFNRLLSIIALRTGQLINFSSISSEVGLPLSTLRRYLALLELTYQIYFIYPYYTNISKRLIKTPKVYYTDTGMVCNITATGNWRTLELQNRDGFLIETWVANELKKMISYSKQKPNIYFLRSQLGKEIDFVLAYGESIVGIEVKWSQNITKQELKTVEFFLNELKDRINYIIILYPGTRSVVFNKKIAAIPFDIFFLKS